MKYFNNSSYQNQHYSNFTKAWLHECLIACGHAVHASVQMSSKGKINEF